MNKNSISGCTCFFLHWKSEHLVSRNPPTHPNPNIVRIGKSVRIIGRSLIWFDYLFLYIIAGYIRFELIGTGFDKSAAIAVAIGETQATIDEITRTVIYCNVPRPVRTITHYQYLQGIDTVTKISGSTN